MSQRRRSSFVFRKRSFLDPASTDHTSYVHAIVESSRDGEYQWGTNMVYLADCKKQIELEFFLGTRRHRRLALRKIDLLIRVLTSFRDALAKQIALIEKVK
ncbi:MAG TPA: hypothetical protein VFY60_03955 [Pyrinomonadaceae bacterium]|nr:hypothetical protein [Pyrinomonadaceae bacterium]